MSASPSALELDDVTMSRGSEVVLERVSFRVETGSIVAVVGPNGAGKTTLLEVIAGLLPSRGEHRALGRPLRSFADRARVLAYMPDEASLPEEVSLSTLFRGVDAKMLARLRVAELADRRAGTLSRGEAKRVSLAMTLALERPVVLLDEPFGVFDPLQLDEVLAVVKDTARNGASVVVTIHQLATASRIADHVVLLAGGRVVAAGTIDELCARANLPEGDLEAVFRRLLADITVEGVDAPA